MFEIDRENPWPPGLNLAAIRAALQALESDMQRVPQLAEAAKSLRDTLREIDRAEAKSPQRLVDGTVTHSRFRSGKR